MLIDGQPVFHPVAVQRKAGAGKMLKGRDSGRVGPAAFFLQRPRQIEMVQRDQRLNAFIGQGGNQLLIKLDPFGIDFTGSLREQTAP